MNKKMKYNSIKKEFIEQDVRNVYAYFQTAKFEKINQTKCKKTS